MNDIALDHSEPILSGDACGALRQWACFPHKRGGERQASAPQTYRLLVASTGGRLAIASITAREPVEKIVAVQLAELIDDRLFHVASRQRIAGEYEARYGMAIELHDIDLDRDNPVEQTAAVSRALVQKTSQISAKSAPISLSELRTSVEKELHLEWRATRDDFIAGLDQESVIQARSIVGLLPSSYSYLNTINVTQRRNRAQALGVFPLLQPVLLSPPFASVRKAIDEGGSLVDALAAHLDAPKALIRALRGITLEDITPFGERLGTVISAMSEIPANWWPRDRESWQQFARTARAIVSVSKQPLCTTTNRLWLRRCAQTGYQTPDRTPEDIENAGREVEEFLDTVRRALAWTFKNTGRRSDLVTGSPSKVVIDLRRGLGLEKLVAVSRRYGDNYRRALTEFADEAELWRGVRWPALGEGRKTYGEVDIVPLLTPDELKAEGLSMSNCVAGYVDVCRKGVSQIWSVRHREGMQLATLETQIRSNENSKVKRLHVRQLLGPRNTQPSPRVVDAVRLHLKFCNASWDTMSAYLDWTKSVVGKPLEVRQLHALMRPVVVGLERTLPRQWSWERLIAAEISSDAVGKDWIGVDIGDG